MLYLNEMLAVSDMIEQISKAQQEKELCKADSLLKSQRNKFKYELLNARRQQRETEEAEGDENKKGD